MLYLFLWMKQRFDNGLPLSNINAWSQLGKSCHITLRTLITLETAVGRGRACAGHESPKGKYVVDFDNSSLDNGTNFLETSITIASYYPNII